MVTKARDHRLSESKQSARDVGALGMIHTFHEGVVPEGMYQIEVIGELRSGDRVVTRGAERLNTGMAVSNVSSPAGSGGTPAVN